MSRSTARVVAGVLAAPALLWGVALVVIVTADLPPLGGAAAGLPIASVALISLSGAIVAAIVASAVAVASAIALALGPVVTPAPAVADPGIETEQRIVFGDHSGHVGYEP